MDDGGFGPTLFVRTHFGGFLKDLIDYLLIGLLMENLCCFFHKQIAYETRKHCFVTYLQGFYTNIPYIFDTRRFLTVIYGGEGNPEIRILGDGKKFVVSCNPASFIM